MSSHLDVKVSDVLGIGIEYHLMRVDANLERVSKKNVSLLWREKERQAKIQSDRY